jgi:two-component system nitrate/nitrite response regulator NarL
MSSYPRKALVVDDHDQMRSLIVNYLEGEDGYTVVGQATNGEEAVRMAEMLEPDVIFMDLSMPVMNGLEALQTIKMHRPAIKIIVVTIHDGRIFRAVADRVKADGYISKNSFISDLRTVLRQIR